MVLERNVRCIERNDLALYSSEGLERSGSTEEEIEGLRWDY